jgi:hypothetical protein
MSKIPEIGPGFASEVQVVEIQKYQKSSEVPEVAPEFPEVDTIVLKA